MHLKNEIKTERKKKSLHTDFQQADYKEYLKKLEKILTAKKNNEYRAK